MRLPKGGPDTGGARQGAGAQVEENGIRAGRGAAAHCPSDRVTHCAEGSESHCRSQHPPAPHGGDKGSQES